MRNKLFLATLVTAIVIGLIAVVVNTNNDVQLQQLDVKTKQNEINTLNELNETYKIKLKDAEGNAEQIKQLEQEQQELKQENERLQQELAIKRAKQIEDKKNVAYAAKPITGDKQSWLKASGIPADQWWAVDVIVSRESGWNPNALNPTSGACGLGQQLPCGKWAGAWNDPVAALKGQYGYVVARYGGYTQAVAFWNANHWY